MDDEYVITSLAFWDDEILKYPLIQVIKFYKIKQFFFNLKLLLHIEVGGYNSIVSDMGGQWRTSIISFFEKLN